MSGAMIAVMLLAAPAPIADERRLSPVEVERILEEAARKRIAQDKPPPRLIEGEVGVTIGSGGTRELFGTAVVPVGAQGVAILSIGSAESDRPRTRRRR